MELSNYTSDYYQLNEVTIKNYYPFPYTDDLLHCLPRSSIINYYQIGLKTIFQKQHFYTRNDNHYVFLIMSFGLTNALNTFQKRE